MRQIIIWLLAALAIAGASAASAEYPARPNGPILDAAEVIAPELESGLDAKLRAYSAQTGRAVIIATVLSLDDLPVEDYAQTLAETWDIGGKETEQGVLILVAPNERKIRIHANRGVQERLPDVVLSRIVRDTMTPKFKANDLGGGIASGVDAIIAQLDRDPADAQAIVEAAAAKEAAEARGDRQAGPGAVIFWIMMILFFMLMFGRRGHRGYRRSGIDPGVVLWGLSEIAHHASRGGGSGGFDFGSSGGGGGGFGGFGGGGSGFDGGGASGSW